MDQIIDNFKSIASELIIQKTIDHKPGGILSVALNAIASGYGNAPNKKRVTAYEKIFYFLDFDSFAQIKELYSSNTYKFLPTWDKYFELHNIIRHCKKKNTDPVRLIFTKIKSAKDRQNEIRSPYWINLCDIDYAGYYKLLKFLILCYYTVDNRINASCFGKFGQKAAIETNAAYVLVDGRRIKSIEQCIDEHNEDALIYLVEQLEIKPTWHQLNRIEKVFPSIIEMITYYFE